MERRETSYLLERGSHHPSIKKPGEDVADPRIQAVSAYLSYWEGDGKNDNRKINPLCRK